MLYANPQNHVRILLWVHYIKDIGSRLYAYKDFCHLFTRACMTLGETTDRLLAYVFIWPYDRLAAADVRRTFSAAKDLWKSMPPAAERSFRSDYRRCLARRYGPFILEAGAAFGFYNGDVGTAVVALTLAEAVRLYNGKRLKDIRLWTREQHLMREYVTDA